MALPILDGNQTSTTLATTVSGGAHYPNHIIASAVTISSIPAISGTVTANTVLAPTQPIYESSESNANRCILIGTASYEGGQVFHTSPDNPLPISGTVTANVGLSNISGEPFYSVIATGGDNITSIFQKTESGIWKDLGNNTLSYNEDSVRWEIKFQGMQLAAYSNDYGAIPPQTGWVAQGDYNVISVTRVSAPVYGTVTIGSLPAISGTVTANVTNSITVGSLPVQLSTTTIGGTARLNVTLSSATTVGGTAPSYANLYGGSDGTNLRAISVDTSGRTVVTVSNFPSTQPVSLASLPSLAAGTAQIGSVTASISGTPTVTMGSISGTVTANVSSTTVTVSALPNGALTTRFGSVTTANTAQLTAAVTNTSRKYLLAQNISAGTVTIGIGFSPTTTQGIQLTAGGGITFDSFCPTGAVWWLGATTGATWTILEG